MLPLADHPGVTAIPFVVPPLIVVCGLLVLVLRDRVRRRRNPEGMAD